MAIAAELAQLIDDPSVAASVTQLVEKLVAEAREATERKAREVER